MLGHADVRTTMVYTHCGSQQNSEKSKNHLIIQLLAPHGNIGKPGMVFAYIDNTAIMLISWTNCVQLIPC